jgi:hypothetical protein
MIEREIFSVSDHHENNASPDCSSSGGGGYESQAEAIARAEYIAGIYKCRRVKSKEMGGVLFFAERVVPWTLSNRSSCPTCGGPYKGKPRVPRPPVRRYGPAPRISRPYAERYEVKVEKRKVWDWSAESSEAVREAK